MEADMPMSFQELDQANIVWQQLPIEQHLSFFVMSTDEDNKIVDVFIKMSANEQVFLHRHTAPNYRLVLSGEHRLYEADGTLKDIRPAEATQPAQPTLSHIERAMVNRRCRTFQYSQPSPM
jgi:hypothetical protein